MALIEQRGDFNIIQSSGSQSGVPRPAAVSTLSKLARNANSSFLPWKEKWIRNSGGAGVCVWIDPPVNPIITKIGEPCCRLGVSLLP